MTSSFTVGTGDLTGTFTFNPPTNTVTSASITTTAGERQLAGGPISGATYSNILSSDAGSVRVSSGPPALGGRTITLAFSPNLAGGAPTLTSQFEATCTSADCGSGSFDRQGVSNASVTNITPPASIPTMSEWAMIVFGVLLAGGAALMTSRRRLA